MKIENGSRYQETEIVSYVQVINKAEIDRYLKGGKRKSERLRAWGRSWGRREGGLVSPKRTKCGKKGKRGNEREGEKAMGGKLERV